MKTKFISGTFFGIVAVSVIVFGLIITSIGCSTCASITGSHNREATSQAQTWATKLGMKVKAISCAWTDSDGDGYVSCTIVENLEKGDTKMHNVECAGAWNLNEGCRLPKLQIPGRDAE